MAMEWEIDGPRVLDIGGERETVAALKVALVAGRLDVVTHDDSPAARLEVHEVTGRPLKVTWTGSTLKVTHVKEKDGSLWEGLKAFSRDSKDLSARVSLSIPSAAAVKASTVSADALITGIHNDVKLNTVSGSLTLDDVVGDVDANTVSGEIECHAVRGDFKGNSVSGSLTVLASQLVNIKLNTVSGDLTLDLTDGRARVQSNSVSGDVTLRIPTGGGFDVSAHTMSGHVIIDGRAMPKATFGSQSGGSLQEGDGALRVKATSVSGDVVVLRAQSNGQAGSTDDGLAG
ncbi:MAG TPA: DUF4097 family beta strand repeat-containing protein [Segeticoccus sp.]|uniref:DUF4097 family beta strand repeat-containing protein n=1 Tax=Segeticoccus sp. TaxID=2706531 RepID=UPI002D805D70|nr:DUF4097 family beta strand repeat-containing protein [Segeticoccus sp.]HET8601764.1 DUF4097 family beta strand repeat-containing protein [Segeticoccus sp.]